ncbi:expressed unknown protein [Seminavis robusta]|uniref:Uncharacterized protein n=1 Tax=Seminavis robusta TaxID=568900 RepID=A0A9N8EV72_9STRA|nr:expressed unknown protein [Seminavis robusta]|eukprot:Sro2321_g323210.1 n/a (141) ;mRNA; r:10486-11462
MQLGVAVQCLSTLPMFGLPVSPEQWVEGLDKRWTAFGLQVQMSGCHHNFGLYVDDMIFFSSDGQADNVSVENGKIVAADEPAKIDELGTCFGKKQGSRGKEDSPVMDVVLEELRQVKPKRRQLSATNVCRNRRMSNKTQK